MGKRGAHTATERRARRPTAARRWVVVRFWVGIAVALAIVGVVFVGPAVISSYDADHRTTITCDVTASEGMMQSSSSRGIGGPIAQVVITTSDCGRLLLRDGVTRSNNEGIAARLSPPGEYRIEVGTASWNVRGLLHALRRDPTAYGFEPAP
jgi:hypothetical protein